MIRHVVLSIGLALALFACKAEPPQDKPAAEKQVPAGEESRQDTQAAPAPEVQAEPDKVVAPQPAEPAPEPIDFAPTLETVMPFLPSDTLVLGVLEPVRAAQASADTIFGSILDEAMDEQTKKELSKFIAGRISFDPLGARHLVLFESLSGYTGLILAGDHKLTQTEDFKPVELEGQKAFNHRGDPRFYAVQLAGAGVLLLESRTAASQYLRDKKNTLDAHKSETFKRLLAGATGRSDAWFAMTADLQNENLANMWPDEIEFRRPDKASVYVSNKTIHLVVEGSEDAVASIVKAMNEGKEQARIALQGLKGDLDSMDLAPGVGIIIGEALARRTFDILTPKQEAGKLTLDIDLEKWGTITMMGVSAAIAIPSFVKYKRKAKTTEAIDTLDKIAKGATAYFSSPRVAMDTGLMLPPQFPKSSGMTPKVGTCCASLGGPDRNDNDKCDPAPGDWATETWSALYFQMSDEHYFVYDFTSNGKTGNDAEFTVSAYGDLDCDGIKSTYQRFGRGKVENSERTVENGNALYIENEGE
jgi:hypothetical protein